MQVLSSVVDPNRRTAETFTPQPSFSPAVPEFFIDEAVLESFIDEEWEHEEPSAWDTIKLFLQLGFISLTSRKFVVMFVLWLTLNGLHGWFVYDEHVTLQERGVTAKALVVDRAIERDNDDTTYRLLVEYGDDTGFVNVDSSVWSQVKLEETQFNVSYDPTVANPTLHLGRLESVQLEFSAVAIVAVSTSGVMLMLAFMTA